jgi:arginine/lysine/ornithine decarboxylase
MMAVFATTSPSYLILQSLDLCNKYLAEGYRERLGNFIARLDEVKDKIKKVGFEVCNTEPLKIVIDAAASGYGGEELARHLRGYKIEPEMVDNEYVVLMATPETRDIDIDRLLLAFYAISPKAPKPGMGKSISVYAERAVSIREAIFSPSEVVSVCDAEGRICGTPAVSCPPAIPIVVSGERISREAIELFRAYGIDTVRVLV